MEPLVSVNQLFTWLCICPVDGTVSEWKKTARVPVAIANFAIMVSHFIASLVFLIRFVTTDLPGSLFALMCCCGDFSIVYILITALILRHRVNEIFKGLSAIYSTCKYYSISSLMCVFWIFRFYSDGNVNANPFLARANDKSEWWWGIYCKYMYGTFGSVILNAISSVVSCWLANGQFEADHVYHPVNVM